MQLTTVQSPTIMAGRVRLTPESQILVLRLPFGGVVWHRPTAVVVEQAGRASQRLPILDLTRVALVSVIAVGLLLTLLVSLRQREA